VSAVETGEGVATGAEQPRPERPARRAPQKPPRPRRGVAVNDPVADMLTRVRNATRARHDTVAIPTSRLKAELARILHAEGFISGYEIADRDLLVRLKYVGKESAITGLRRVSRPGLRAYARRTELPRVLGGLGVAIISTSSGLMSAREAQRRGLGGEILAHVW
jgi:small subunit ribosomal protein S8